MSIFKGFLANRFEAIIQLFLLIGILVLINMLADRQILRLDLTDDKRYTLSDASKEIARNLDDPITITAYFSKNLPPQLERGKREFRNFLEEFRAHSGGFLEFRFIDPAESEDAEIRAQQAGVSPVLIDVRERDQISQQRAYLGAVFNFGEETEILPVIEPGTAMEYNIANAIKRLTSISRHTVGVLQGHGQPPVAGILQLTNALAQQYEVTEAFDIQEDGVPPNIDLLLIVAPRTELNREELIAIDQYILSGGRVIFALNGVEADLETMRGRVISTGLEDLTAHYGIRVNEDLVRDWNASSISVQQQQGMFTFMNQIEYPYIPVIFEFPDHPITSGLDGVVLQFASSLSLTPPDTGFTHQILAETSERSGVTTGDFNIDPFREWTQRDFLEAHLPLAVLSEGHFTTAFPHIDGLTFRESAAPGAFIVIGNGNFIISGEGRAQQRLPANNINFMVNMIDWLVDDTGLIAIRNKVVTNRPLDSLEDGTQTFLKYLNTFLPVLLISAYGLIRYRRRQSQRKRWMEEGV